MVWVDRSAEAYWRRLDSPGRSSEETGSSNQLADADVGKFLKLVGDSQFGLCAVGDEIQAVLDSGPDQALTDGFAIGGVRKNPGMRVRVMLDGLHLLPVRA